MADLVYLAKMSVNFCTLSFCTSCLIIITKRNVDVVLLLHRCAKDISQDKLFLYYYLNTFNELKKKQGEETNPCHLHLP